MSYKIISAGPRLSVSTIRNMIRFYGEELSAPRPTPKLQNHPLSAVRDCLFNIFVAMLHIGGRSSIRNLRTRHAVVTGTHLSRTLQSTVVTTVVLRRWCALSYTVVELQIAERCYCCSNFINQRYCAKQEKQCTHKSNNETLSRNPLFPWKISKYYIFWICVCSLSYVTCAAHAPYCHVIHKRHDFRKKRYWT
jgi:hypothetical protein